MYQPTEEERKKKKRHMSTKIKVLGFKTFILNDPVSYVCVSKMTYYLSIFIISSVNPICFIVLFIDR